MYYILLEVPNDHLTVRVDSDTASIHLLLLLVELSLDPDFITVIVNYHGEGLERSGRIASVVRRGVSEPDVRLVF
jgi:hypothetical protein